MRRIGKIAKLQFNKVDSEEKSSVGKRNRGQRRRVVSRNIIGKAIN